MQGRQFFEAVQALPDGGHSAVVVERDGWFWPVEGVEFNSEHFVVLKLGDTPEGAATGRTCSLHPDGPVGYELFARENPWRKPEPVPTQTIPVSEILPNERIFWCGSMEKLVRRDVEREERYGNRLVAWLTDAGAGLTWPLDATVLAWLPRPEPS